MNAPQSLRKPENWQDFETLCKKLWGEIWNCSEIKKNGRIGQAQYGVDIYGIPKDEKEYYGIQCKGRDEYNNKLFTQNEILKEIESAKFFKPKLKKLYLATTALKDVAIEKFVREKNIEHINDGLFEVHLFCWEDIVDLIDENRQTHDWYLKSQNFKTKKEAKITFDDDAVLLEQGVIFANIVHSSNRMSFSNNRYSGPLGMLPHNYDPYNLNFQAFQQSSYEIYVNCSYFGFQIKMLNTGSESIEEYHISLEFDGQVADIAHTNEFTQARPIKSNHSNVEIDSSRKKVRITPGSTLVAGDSFISDEIYVRPARGEKKLKVKWRLLANDFNDHGELSIKINTHYEIVGIRELMDDPCRDKNRQGEYGDYILPKSHLEEFE